MIKKIFHKKKLYALIIPKKFTSPGINFFTPGDYSQQIGYINYKKGHKIIPHIHKKVSRIIYQTNEVLFIKKGKIRIDFFEDNLQNYLAYGSVLFLFKIPLPKLKVVGF